ncbi:hypothetical protein ACWD62_43075 [Streptomyces sp. NPDC005146]
MLWWLKARRAHQVLPCALAAYLFLAAAIQDTTALLPSFTTGIDPVPLMLFVPMPLVAGLMLCLESRLPSAEVTATRQVIALDTTLILGVVAAANLVSLAAFAALGSTEAATTGRNTAFLVGMMLTVRAVVGQPAVMAPVLWLVTVLLFGFKPGNDPYPWTVLPEPLEAPHAAWAAALTLGLGLVAHHHASRTLP